MFDPEKVDVWRGWDMEPYTDFDSGKDGWVERVDYEQLLALYKACYLENIRLLNDASVWRNRAITAEEELKGSNRIGPRPRNYKGIWR